MPSTRKPWWLSPSDSGTIQATSGRLAMSSIALPRDVVRRVADAEHGIEQQLDAAAARADDQIGAGDRVGEALPRAGAHLLDAEQQHDAEGDGEHGEAAPSARGCAAIAGPDADDGRGRSCGGTPSRDRDVVEPQHAVEARRRAAPRG